MKFLIKKDGSEAIMSFTDKDMETLQKNKNNFIIRGKDLPHLMKVITSLSDALPDDNTNSLGNEEFIPQDIPKK